MKAKFNQGLARVRKAALKKRKPKTVLRNRATEQKGPTEAPKKVEGELSPDPRPREKGWMRKKSDQYDAHYWYNWNTDTSTWERPGNSRLELEDIFGITVKAYNGQGRMFRTNSEDDHRTVASFVWEQHSAYP